MDHRTGAPATLKQAAEGIEQLKKKLRDAQRSAPAYAVIRQQIDGFSNLPINNRRPAKRSTTPPICANRAELPQIITDRCATVNQAAGDATMGTLIAILIIGSVILVLIVTTIAANP